MHALVKFCSWMVKFSYVHAVDSCGSQSSPAENTNAGTNKEETPNFVSSERSTVAKLDNPSHEKHTLEEAQLPVALSSSVSADATSVVHVASDFGLSSSSTSTVVVLPKTENHGRTAKVNYVLLLSKFAG